MTLVDAFLILLPPVAALVAARLINWGVEGYRRQRQEAREGSWVYQAHS
jgi:hypothetical protein